jgi:membrane protein implicated in regulation of membrane protease activity
MMNPRIYTLATSGNPVVQVLALLAFGVALIGAVLMGAVLLAFVFGVAVIAASAFAVRLWWLRRKIARGHRKADQRPSGDGRLIEAEYTVLAERDTRRSERAKY